MGGHEQKRRNVAASGSARWGSQSMVDATFNGFKALPDPTDSSWQDILGVFGPLNDLITLKKIKSQYRFLAKKYHPDHGGDSDLAFQYLLPGFKCVGYVEIEEYPRKIIKQRIKDGLLDAAPTPKAGAKEVKWNIQ
jgi:hypothetical protein